MNDKELKACPECQQNKESGMNFCAFCGRQLWSEDLTEPKQEEYRHCKFCKDNCSEYDACDPYEYMSPATVIIKCDKKAKEVFAWLKENNYKITNQQ